MELREEPPAYGSAPALSPAERALVADLVTDGLSIQQKFRPEPLYKQTGKGHYASDTVEEIRRNRFAAKRHKRRTDEAAKGRIGESAKRGVGETDRQLCVPKGALHKG